MLDLTKQEKVILIFLSLTFVTGLGISAYKKSAQATQLVVQPYKIEALEEADQFIEEERFININSSNLENLRRLPGVGEKLAERIVQYRSVHSAFTFKEELMQVKGIGEKKFEEIKGLIVLE